MGLEAQGDEAVATKISDELAALLHDGPVLDASCKEEVANSVLHILEAVGEDVTREGLWKTPERVARMYDEILAGYTVDPVSLLNEALFDVDYAEMIVVSGIEFYGVCEHHLLPIIGEAHVAYVPDQRVVGALQDPAGGGGVRAPPAGAGANDAADRGAARRADRAARRGRADRRAAPLRGNARREAGERTDAHDRAARELRDERADARGVPRQHRR